MMPSEQKQETPRVWLSPPIAERFADNEQGARFADDILYVPESELARVRRETWDAAIAIVRDRWDDSYSNSHPINDALYALEAARDGSEGQGLSTTTEGGE